VYRGPIKQTLQVLWMEMIRRQQSHKAGIEQEILRRIAELDAASDAAPAEPTADPPASASRRRQLRAGHPPDTRGPESRSLGQSGEKEK